MGVAHFRTIAACCLIAAAASGHEIGTTRVEASFRRDHTYSIEVWTSRESLQRRHVTPRMFAQAVEVRFDGQRVVPLIHPGFPIRIEGEIPAGARTFTWRYGLTFTSYALNVTSEGSPPQTQWISADETSIPVSLSRHVIPPTRGGVIRQYLALGFTHIVPYGLDHILFVLGIFLLCMQVKPVLTQVTAFTIAHSITLALTLYGVVAASPRIVEPMIALSIAYVGIENIFTSQVRASRVALVFAFGLLHGMGFAGVLRELGLPRSQFLPALVAFNAGVEGGQLSVIAAAYLLFGWWAKRLPAYRLRFVVPLSAAIAITGMFWMVQRIFF